VSFLTLALGTAFNVLLWRSNTNATVRALACMWQFVLFMQVFEGLSWISKETQNSQLSDFSTRCAFVFNVLQPVFAALLCLGISSSLTVKYMLITLTVMYLTVLLYSVSSTSFLSPLFGNYSATCNHLQLYWWEQFSGLVFIFYMILLSCACFSFTPTSLGVVQWTYIIVTFILSHWLYPCTYGSIWCWFAAFAPVFTYCYLEMYPIL